MPNSACQTKKKVIPASDCDRRWKVDLFSESWTQEILGWSRLTINIFLKTKSLRTEDDAVWWNQEGVIYYELLKPVNAYRINNWSNCTVLYVKKGCRKDMTSWFSSTTTHHRTRQQWFKTTWRHSTGKCYPIPLIHQIWHLLTITCFRRWATRSAEWHFDFYEDVQK